MVATGSTVPVAGGGGGREGEREGTERGAEAQGKEEEGEEESKEKGVFEGLYESGALVQELLRYQPVWAIIVAQYTSSWGLYGMLNWLPTIISERYGIQLQDSATMTSLPYLLQGVVGALSGGAADALIRNGMSVKRCRQLMQGGGMLLPALFLLLSSSSSSPEQATTLLTIGLATSALRCYAIRLPESYSAFGTDAAYAATSVAGVSVSHLDIAPQRAGLVFGMGNFAATLGGFISVWATGQIAEATGSWATVLAVISLHYVVGAVIWLAWVGDKDILSRTGEEMLSDVK